VTIRPIRFWLSPAVVLLLAGCGQHGPLFQRADPAGSGVTFVNQLQETETENVLAFEYFYNGGGVAIGDLTNDGRADLFFTGNQVPNKLYVNQTEPGGTLRFADESERAGTGGRAGGWKTGITLADVNADGWLDVYVCYSGLRAPELRRNQLFINNHNLTFTDRAPEYGLDDPGYGVQATFFDYDKDGDLDCLLINHNLKNYQRKEAAVMRNTRDEYAGDKLFRNNGKGHFDDVSAQAGIKGNPMGFGLGASVSDLNGDDWPDIYVTNDYVEDDYLYINQHDGTFRDELRDRIDHSSYSAMGVDIADLDNDGRTDIMTLDMRPEDNTRQKTLPWPDNWNVYQARLQNGFWHQNMQNTLQMQQADGRFADMGELAGVSATDWSWGTLLADFDNDGFKDIFVSNGMLRDFTDGDFIRFSEQAEASQTRTSLLDQIRAMPATKTRNYAFHNTGNGTFANRQADWGFDDPTVANGCAYADLDNDGDLDLVTNNLNEPARVFVNQTRDREQGHYLKIHLKGPAGNPFGVGAKVTVRQAGLVQTQEFYPTRGFESSSHGDLVFGLPDGGKVVGVGIRWPDGREFDWVKTGANQTLIADYRQARSAATPRPAVPVDVPLFSAIPAPDFTHAIPPTNSFNGQVLLPTQYAYTGPRMTTADINLDGQTDVFVCGTAEQPGRFLVTKNGQFEPQRLPDPAPRKNTDAAFADVDGDNRPDLYVVNGGYEVRDAVTRQDQLWLNKPGGWQPQPLPTETANGSCVEPLDFDHDGDLDLFVGGSVLPLRYPAADESFLLRNDGKGRFTAVSLGQLGMVTDAVSTDLNRDGWADLVLVGEWMPVTIWLNQRSVAQPFNPARAQPVPDSEGWWNRLAKADLDGDGDDDLIAGNLGENSPVRASVKNPATLVYDDFDQNGTLDFFMNYQVGDKVFPAYGRDEICEQVPTLRRRFTNYRTYAKHKTITKLSSMIFENQDGKLIPHPLPQGAQIAPVHAILPTDINHDGRIDLLLMGNNSQMRLRIGKLDANHGVVAVNKGNWLFDVQPAHRTGLWLKGDVRDLVRVKDTMLIGINNGPLVSYKLN
jgi:enediyne biosynthesis protein E4